MYKNITKKIGLWSLLFVLTFASCDDDLLDTKPLTATSPSSFFKTAAHLKIYANRFYNSLPGGSYGVGYYGGDRNTDNLLSSSLPPSRLAVLSPTVPSGVGDYSWGDIRAVNYFFANIGDLASSTDADTKQYIGEVYFFRAWYYFGLLKQFGNLPWIDKPLKPNIKDLALARISRHTIVENIVKDLDKAIAKMRDGSVGEYNRLNKYCALQFKARVCLYEGTWEKHHAGTTFGVSGKDGSDFLAKARDAAKEIIDSGRYGLWKGVPLLESKYAAYVKKDLSGKVIESDYGRYEKLFLQRDYSGNREVIFWKKLDSEKGLTLTNHSLRWGTAGSLTKDFVGSFLMNNGKSLTEEIGKLYQGDIGLLKPYPNRIWIMVDKFLLNRDPRLLQSVHHFGTFQEWDKSKVDRRTAAQKATDLRKYPLDDTTPTHAYSTFYMHPNHDTHPKTFILQRKGYDADDELGQDSQSDAPIGSIIFRYAEVLLIYAEAQAELGNDAEAKAQIDKLRERVGMPKLSVVTPTDPMKDSMKGESTISRTLYEVRRERRIELFAEGFRFDDMMRWRVAHLMNGKRPKGIQWEKNTDLRAIWEKKDNRLLRYPHNTPDADITKDSRYDNARQYLPIKDKKVDAQGFLDPYRLSAPAGYQFDKDVDYLKPIGKEAIALSQGKLKQNPGWEARN